MADKILVMTAFIMLVELGFAPAWVVAIIICRELAVTGLRLLLVENGGTVLAAAMPGKIKTFSQMFAVIFLLLHWNVVGQITLYIALFFTLYSGYDYFRVPLTYSKILLNDDKYYRSKNLKYKYNQEDERYT